MFEIDLIIYIKIDLALNNLQRLICHKTEQTNKQTNHKKEVFCIVVIRYTNVRISKILDLKEKYSWEIIHDHSSEGLGLGLKRTRYTGHCWWSKDQLISDVILLTPTRPLTSHLTNTLSQTNRTSGPLLVK